MTASGSSTTTRISRVNSYPYYSGYYQLFVSGVPRRDLPVPQRIPDRRDPAAGPAAVGRGVVDGYYAGRVDDFAGFIQALRIEEGPHTIEIVANGYETRWYSTCASSPGARSTTGAT